MELLINYLVLSRTMPRRNKKGEKLEKEQWQTNIKEASKYGLTLVNYRTRRNAKTLPRLNGDPLPAPPPPAHTRPPTTPKPSRPPSTISATSRPLSITPEPSRPSTTSGSVSGIVSRPVIIARTLSQGDCFFSAIYRASVEQDLLQKLKECHPSIDISNEDDFVITLRRLVSANADSSLKFLYNFLYDLYTSRNKNSIATLKEQMSDPARFDRWQKQVINKYILGSKPDLIGFITEYKRGIETRTNYASDIEIWITRDLFEFCGIKFMSFNTAQSVLKNKDKDGNDIINLYNSGGFHYEYFSFITYGGKRSRKTRKRRSN